MKPKYLEREELVFFLNNPNKHEFFKTLDTIRKSYDIFTTYGIEENDVIIHRVGEKNSKEGIKDLLKSANVKYYDYENSDHITLSYNEEVDKMKDILKYEKEINKKLSNKKAKSKGFSL